LSFTGAIELPWMIGGVVIVVILSFIFYLMYSSLVGNYGYEKPVPDRNGGYSGKKVLILGGRQLLPEAEKKDRHLALKRKRYSKEPNMTSISFGTGQISSGSGRVH
jgi:hypothetical protein